MKKNEKDLRYDMLYTDIWLFSLDLHKRHKRRIKIGIIVMLLLPVILGLIRWLTHSDKIAFLLIYVICLFAVGIYLIAIEYLDDQIWKTLRSMTDSEADFNSLIVDRRWVSQKVNRAVRKHKEKTEGGDDE